MIHRVEYDYDKQRDFVFTDVGQRQFLSIRDKIGELLREAGAVRMQEAIQHEVGSSWDMLACVDRLVELGELKELMQPNISGQFRVFVKGYRA